MKSHCFVTSCFQQQTQELPGAKPARAFAHRSCALLSFVLFFFSIFLTSCLQSPTYQASESIPKAAWAYAYRPIFQFDVTDTAARYNVYFLMRHTDAYPFSNLWVWIETKAPGDSTFQRVRVEVPLAKSNGQWLARGDEGITMGTSTGAIWEHRTLLTPRGPMRFEKAGRYTVRFEQAMRTSPLPEVLQVGLRIEKR